MKVEPGSRVKAGPRFLGAAVAVALVAAIAAAPASPAATKTTKATKASAKTTKATKATAKTTKATKTTTRATTQTTKRAEAVTTTAAARVAPAPVPATRAPVATPSTVRSTRLVVYSGRNERLVKPILDQFTFITGIDLEIRYADSSQLAATLLEEGDRTRAAVFFSQDAGALGALGKAGRLATLPDRLLQKVAKEYRAKDGTWVGLSGRARVFAYDPRQVPVPPDSIADLTNARWRGQIAYAPTNASWHSFVTALRVAVGEDGARKWLTDFKANAPRGYASNGAVLQAVNRGEVALGLVNHYYLYERIAADGAANVTTRNAYPEEGDPGALVNVAGAAVLKRAANDSAAVELVEFLLSRDAQRYFAEKTFEYPLVNGVPHFPGLPALQTVKGPDIDLSDLDSIAKTLTLLRDVGLV